MRYCDYCGRGYEPKQKRQRFCSKHCSRKWWKEHPPIHTDPQDGTEVLRTFECKLCRKEVKVVSTRDHRTQFCCAQHEREYWKHDYQRHNSGRTRENQGMSSAMSLGSLIKRERRDLD